METIKFAKFDEGEMDCVRAIMQRARDEEFHTETLLMDLAAVHHHHPLQLEELATVDNLTFRHDIHGILRHMNRETGELGDCFVPRMARTQ